MHSKTLTHFVFILALCATAKAGVSGSSSKSLYSKGTQPSVSSSNDSASSTQGRLARVTAYWPGEDYYTNHKLSATGVRLRDGICAVDSSIIPYGSVVKIPGLGNYVAMDTGTAVISRKAAKESGHNPEERSALVIDLYFASRRAGELFSREGPKFALVAWESGDTTNRE
jgi:3D (Asp-Asp-Asp) domain-containing protein